MRQPEPAAEWQGVDKDLFDATIKPRVGAIEFELAPGSHTAKNAAKVTSTFEVAMLDLQGQIVRAPIVDLLGGAAKTRPELRAQNPGDFDCGVGSGGISLVGAAEGDTAGVDAVDSQTLRARRGNGAGIIGDQSPTDGSSAARPENASAPEAFRNRTAVISCFKAIREKFDSKHDSGSIAPPQNGFVANTGAA